MSISNADGALTSDHFAAPNTSYAHLHRAAKNRRRRPMSAADGEITVSARTPSAHAVAETGRSPFEHPGVPLLSIALLGVAWSTLLGVVLDPSPTKTLLFFSRVFRVVGRIRLLSR